MALAWLVARAAANTAERVAVRKSTRAAAVTAESVGTRAAEAAA